MSNITRIEKARTSKEAIDALSADLEEELRTTAQDAAVFTRRYAQLKACRCRYVTEDGEVLTKAQWERECDGLNKLLKEYIERTQEPVRVEGLPPLVLKPKTETWYRLPMMLRNDPAMLDFLLEQGLVAVKAEARKLAETSPQLTGLRKYAVQGAGSPALTWERQP